MSVVSAQKMSRVGYRPSIVNAIIKNQIALINAKLNKFEKIWGMNVLMHQLPSEFDIPGLPKDRAQMMIYSKIIVACENAGYVVKLKIHDKKNKTIIALKWESSISSEELETMENILERAMNFAPTKKVDAEPSDHK